MVWQVMTFRFEGGAWWSSERRAAALPLPNSFSGGVREC
jgi:hypothetical protein